MIWYVSWGGLYLGVVIPSILIFINSIFIPPSPSPPPPFRPLRKSLSLFSPSPRPFPSPSPPWIQLIALSYTFFATLDMICPKISQSSFKSAIFIKTLPTLDVGYKRGNMKYENWKSTISEVQYSIGCETEKARACFPLFIFQDSVTRTKIEIITGLESEQETLFVASAVL